MVLLCFTYNRFIRALPFRQSQDREWRPQEGKSSSLNDGQPENKIDNFQFSNFSIANCQTKAPHLTPNVICSSVFNPDTKNICDTNTLHLLLQFILTYFIKFVLRSYLIHNSYLIHISYFIDISYFIFHSYFIHIILIFHSYFIHIIFIFHSYYIHISFTIHISFIFHSYFILYSYGFSKVYIWCVCLKE